MLYLIETDINNFNERDRAVSKVTLTYFDVSLQTIDKRFIVAYTPVPKEFDIPVTACGDQVVITEDMVICETNYSLDYCSPAHAPVFGLKYKGKEICWYKDKAAMREIISAIDKVLYIEKEQSQ